MKIILNHLIPLKERHFFLALYTPVLALVQHSQNLCQSDFPMPTLLPESSISASLCLGFMRQRLLHVYPATSQVLDNLIDFPWLQLIMFRSVTLTVTPLSLHLHFQLPAGYPDLNVPCVTQIQSMVRTQTCSPAYPWSSFSHLRMSAPALIGVAQWVEHSPQTERSLV